MRCDERGSAASAAPSGGERAGAHRPGTAAGAGTAGTGGSTSAASGGARLAATGGPTTPMQVALVHDWRRRHRLVRIVAQGLLVSAALMIPSALLPSFNGPVLVAILLAAVGSAGAFLLSRRGLVDVAGILIVGALAAAIALTIAGKALHQGGLDVSDLRLFDLFGLPILLCAVLVNRSGTLILTAFTTSYTVMSLFALPKTAAMVGYLASHYPVPASPVDAISVALFAQCITAVAAWLGADSVRRSLLEASRADEVALANVRLQAQAAEMEAQRRRLREGIARIQSVHAAVASGRWDARASVEEGELLPVATSLNLLLDRLARLAREQGERGRLEAAAHQLAETLRKARSGEEYELPAYTGTAEDEVLVELTALLRDSVRPRQPSVPVRGAQLRGPKMTAAEVFGIAPESLPPVRSFRPPVSLAPATRGLPFTGPDVPGMPGVPGVPGVPGAAAGRAEAPSVAIGGRD